LISLFFSVLALFISLIISRRLTTPLKYLMTAAQEMAAGHRNISVKEEGTTELIKLARTFNQMSKKIDSHEQILKNEIHKATKSLSEKIDMLETLSDISQTVIDKNFSQKEVILVILKKLKAFLACHQISITLWNEQHHQQLPLYVIHQEEDITEHTMSCPDSPICLAIKEGKPIIRNLDSEALFSFETDLYNDGIRSLLIIPLIAQEKVIGTLNICCQQKDYFHQQSIDQISVFTYPVAMALDRALAYESLKKSAYYDYLTGLPNHRFFKERLTQTLKEIKNHPNRMLAVMFLDLDRFKIINDTLGHDFGDKVIQKVGELLIDALEEKDTIARLGGDEFTILLPDLKNLDEAIYTAEKITNLFHSSLIIDDYDINVTASIGIALYPTDGEDAHTLIKHADMAMYRIKEQGKNDYTVYTPLKNDPYATQFYLEKEIRNGLEKKEFFVYYQPTVHIETGEIIGMEALIRWNHPTKGVITSGEFIHIAEETGLIVPLGEYVLKEACHFNVSLQKSGVSPLTVSVNLSTRQFLQSNLYESIARILKETGLSPELLELEITETMTMDTQQAIPILTKLKNLGIKISIDDFGTGYSSLNYLRKLPIDRLKIDRSFISDLSNANNAAIVSTIINMAYHLHLQVTAEGVEDEKQYQFLKRNKCHDIQGFYFSRPLPASEFEKKLVESKSAQHWKNKKATNNEPF